MGEFIRIESGLLIAPSRKLPSQLNDLFRRLDARWGDWEAAILCRLVEANCSGHVCLPLLDELECQRLRKSILVGRPGDYVPLIIDESSRLYFARHWYDEELLAQRLFALASERRNVDSGCVKAWIERLFPGSHTGNAQCQKWAAALAARQSFLAISGGPGTGKTTTVVRLLALLVGVSARPLTIMMAAPTGKAAARLTEAVSLLRDQLALDETIRCQLPASAVTLHRLLGMHLGQVRARYHARNLLPLDVLVIDEASLIDQYLMARTVEALPAGCRLILLGDQDQLASVEAGAVLAQVCQSAHFCPETRVWLQAVCGLAPDATLPSASSLPDCVVTLTYSYRFGAQSGIGRLARAVNANRTADALAMLSAPEYPDVGWLSGTLEPRMLDCRRAYLTAVSLGQDPEAIQRHFLAFMVLAVERSQVDKINRSQEALLEAEGRKIPGNSWYIGRPVMIIENDHSLGLFNGDIGFTVKRSAGLRVLFPSWDKGWREVSVSCLPAHTTAYAMTVHKSQGSEFDEVWLLLPNGMSLALSRALIYTAITRARQRFYIAGHVDVWQYALSQHLARCSGLAARWR